MKRLIVVEPARPGWGHASFNAAMLRALMTMAQFNSCEIVLYAERSHRSALCVLLPRAARILWRPIAVTDPFRRKFIRKFIVELFGICRILWGASKHGDEVILLSVFPNVLAFLMLLKPIFRRIRLHIILHGELETLSSGKRYPIHKQGFWVNLVIRHLFRGSWPRLYVLGAGIRDRILKKLPDCGALANVRSIRHPYIFTSVELCGRERRRVSRIGFVGAGRLVKGVAEFFAMAEELREYIVRGSVEFRLVGGLEREAAQYANEYVDVLGERVVGVEGMEYSREIENLDCAIFLSKQNYSLTASGSIFDAIDKNLEIFALRNDYFEDVAKLDDEGGVSLFETVDALIAAIRRRLDTKMGFGRFRYRRIKREYDAGQGGLLNVMLADYRP